MLELDATTILMGREIKIKMEFRIGLLPKCESLNQALLCCLGEKNIMMYEGVE